MLQFIKDVFEDMRLSALTLLGGVDAEYHYKEVAWADEMIEELREGRNHLRLALREVGILVRRLEKETE